VAAVGLSDYVTGKCLPISLYGFEAFPLKKADLRFFNFVIDRLYVKLFRTNMETLRQCQLFMAALCNRGGALYFCPVVSFLLSSFFHLLFSSPNLSGRRLDVYHTLAHGVALVRI